MSTQSHRLDDSNGPEDPRLTAYALGEMPAAQRAGFEAEIAGDGAAQAEVEAIRAFGGLAAESLTSESLTSESQTAATLTADQREKILATNAPVAANRGARWFAAAAALLVVGSTVFYVQSSGRAGSSTDAPVLMSETAAHPREHPGLASDWTDEIAHRRPMDLPPAADGVELEVPSAGRDIAGGMPAGSLPGGPGASTEPSAVGASPHTGVYFEGRSGGETTEVPGKPGDRRPYRGPGGAVVPGQREPSDPRPPSAPPADGAVFDGPVMRPPPPTAGAPVSKSTISWTGGAGGRTAPSATSAPQVEHTLEMRVKGLRAATEQRNALAVPKPSPTPRPLAPGVHPIQPPVPAPGGGGGGARVPPRVALRLSRHTGEQYDLPSFRGFLAAQKDHTSTFSIDVDTASYANVRRFLSRGQLPPPGAVRLEEMINYFDYGYAPPVDEKPFRTHVAIGACPWNPQHRLARIALKGRVIENAQRPPANLVFLVDVSGSMAGEDKLPLLKTGLELLTETLVEGDTVGIVTYSGSAGVALPSTPGNRKDLILASIRGLRSGGSTNGAAGIQVAYELAKKAFRKGGVNRVLLCTDGDFNVGISDKNRLVELIRRQAKGGVYLSVLGFGTGNYKDAKMEAISNQGNGNYAYIDSQDEAKRVLVEQASQTLVTIAKDVKIQVFFNPKRVKGYRLLGYENRRLAARDFNDDSKDAGEIGAGHAVTALYEIVPVGSSLPGSIDPNPFVEPASAPQGPVESEPSSNALFRLRLRWKAPDGDVSKLHEEDVVDSGAGFAQTDTAFQWAAAVAGYGMLLRRSPFKGQINWELVHELAQGARGEDPKRQRGEMLELIQRAMKLVR